jgi:D-3-phosphoglycerate dehydrogenase
VTQFHVVLSADIDRAGRRLLEEHARVTVAAASDEPSLTHAVADADGLIMRANGRVTEAVLAAAPRLKVIGRHGVGLDNIDLAAAAARGIQVVYTPQANTVSVAEHTVASILAVVRHLARHDLAIRGGDWAARDRMLGTELCGRTAGIVGMGHIGARVAAILHDGFGMSILYSDPRRRAGLEQQLGMRPVPVEQLLAESDVVSLHVPLTAETEGLLNARAIGLMRRSAVLVNVSRGGVVDEQALIDAIDGGRLAGAALDVFVDEPLPADHPLISCERILLTPHSAAMTADAARRMSLVAEDVLAVLLGRSPRHLAPSRQANSAASARGTASAKRKAV